MHKFEDIVNHLITQGFVFPGSEIYGGLANSWDYGPLGFLLKNNVKRAFYKKFVQESPTNVAIDSAIIMNPKVWEATGHVKAFNDPLIDCKECKARLRADEIIKEFDPSLEVEGKSSEELMNIIKDKHIPCPNCGKHNFTDVRQFNMMFQTHIGPSSSNESLVYLRPETAQGMFVNFKNVVRTTRRKLPIGIVNIGKSFRNEITPGNFTFRTREFEQMEMEFFCKPGEDLTWFNYWREYMMNFLLSLKVKEENLRFRDHAKEELAFYSVATTDIEYHYPFGWGELWGIADRTDYDLKRHMEYSKQDLTYLDQETNERYVPYCVEPALGLDRLMLALLCDAYDIETLDNNDSRIVLHLHPAIAPYKVAVLPLSKQLSEKAKEVYKILSNYFSVTFDASGSIGKRYRRQDAIGTPFCITIDFETLEDNQVTIRERDTMQQIRLPINDLVNYFNVKVFF